MECGNVAADRDGNKLRLLFAGKGEAVCAGVNY
jgi:hypothetical protein